MTSAKPASERAGHDAAGAPAMVLPAAMMPDVRGGPHPDPGTAEPSATLRAARDCAAPPGGVFFKRPS